MPGAFVLAQVLFVLLAIVSLLPALLAAGKRKYGLASALAIAGLFVGAGPWFLMFGFGRILGELSAALFIASLLFAPIASCVVLFLPIHPRAEPVSELPIAPWLQSMRDNLEEEQQSTSPSSNQEKPRA